jgi:hypothetical protein
MADEKDSAEAAAPEGRKEPSPHLTRWNDLYARRFTGGVPELTSDEERELWTLTYEILAEKACSVPIQEGKGTAYEVFAFAACAIKSSLDGRPPEAFRPSGGTKLSRLVETSVKTAAAYIRLVRDKTILDKSANKTVRLLYGVKSSTVQYWAKHAECTEQYEKMKDRVLNLEDFFVLAHARRYEVDATRLELARLILHAGGKQYRRGPF